MTLWGSNLRADSLSNIPLNAKGIAVTIPFFPTRNEPIIAARLTSPIRAGYTAGTGGDILMQVIDAFGNLAGQTFLFENATDPYALYNFSPMIFPIAGWKLLIQNVADDALDNWRSVDGFVVSAVDPLDPPNTTMLNGTPHPTNMPMWEVIYASSTNTLPKTQGVGYVDVPNGAAVALSTGVRQILQPNSTRTITGGMISLRGLTAPGLVTLYMGSVIMTQAVLYPPAVPNGWSPFYFQSPVTLTVGGSPYYLVPTGTATAVPLQKGWVRASNGIDKVYTFGPDTFFDEGNAQQMVNGAWSDWISEQGAADPRMDLMFSLFVEG